MAGARNIKPGFFTNDVLAACDQLARLLFAGLWTVADRAGRLEDRPKRIKAAGRGNRRREKKFHAARLATEKAVFRPALPTCFMPGMTEMHMARPSYSEQLKHPNWQRKRLQVLEAHDFTCLECRSKEKTLHVHHKQYLKGRMAWEYDDENFEALCEDCHKEMHERRDLLARVIAQFPSSMHDVLAAVLVGFGHEIVGPEFWLEVDSERAHAGKLAWHMADLKKGESLEAADCFMQLNPARFMAALRSAVDRDFGDT